MDFWPIQRKGCAISLSTHYLLCNTYQTPTSEVKDFYYDENHSKRANIITFEQFFWATSNIFKLDLYIKSLLNLTLSTTRSMAFKHFVCFDYFCDLLKSLETLVVQIGVLVMVRVIVG